MDEILAKSQNFWKKKVEKDGGKFLSIASGNYAYPQVLDDLVNNSPSLDLGCGHGSLILNMINKRLENGKKALHVCGVDLSRDMLELAEVNIRNLLEEKDLLFEREDLGKGFKLGHYEIRFDVIKYVTGDFGTTSTPESYITVRLINKSATESFLDHYNNVYNEYFRSCAAINLFQDLTKEMISESLKIVYHYLKPGGILYAIFQNRENYDRFFKSEVLRKYNPSTGITFQLDVSPPFEQRTYYKEEVIDLFSERGFTNIELSDITYPQEDMIKNYARQGINLTDSQKERIKDGFNAQFLARCIKNENY